MSSYREGVTVVQKGHQHASHNIAVASCVDQLLYDSADSASSGQSTAPEFEGHKTSKLVLKSYAVPFEGVPTLVRCKRSTSYLGSSRPRGGAAHYVCQSTADALSQVSSCQKLEGVYSVELYGKRVASRVDALSPTNAWGAHGHGQHQFVSHGHLKFALQPSDSAQNSCW